MGVFSQIDSILLCFSNDKIDRIACDTISLDTILDTDRNVVQISSLDNIRTQITAVLTQAFTRTTTPSRINVIVKNNMPLYLKHQNGTRRGIGDLQKLIDTLREFIKDPENTEFILYIDCGSLYSHPDLDEYNFDHISTHKFPTPASTPAPSLAPTPSTPPPVLPSFQHGITPPVPPINFHGLPPSVKSRYDAYQNGIFVHYTTLEQDFTWADGSTHKYYEDAVIAQQ